MSEQEQREVLSAEEEIKRAEVRMMIQMMGWTQVQAAEMADVTPPSISQVVHGAKPPWTVWKALLNTVAVLAPRKLPLVFARRWAEGGAQALKDAPLWPRWAEPLFQMLGQMEERQRAQTVAAIIQLLQTSPEGISPEVRAKAEEALLVAKAKVEMGGEGERSERAASPSRPERGPRPGGSRGTNPRPGVSEKDR